MKPKQDNVRLDKRLTQISLQLHGWHSMPPDSSEIKIKSMVGNGVTLKMFLQKERMEERERERQEGRRNGEKERGSQSVSQS